MKLLLASQSLRRRQLLDEADIKYELRFKETDETYPLKLKCEEIARFVAEKKADAFSEKEIPANGLILTADTIVWLKNEALFKPENEKGAIEMLGKLSGKKHIVATGVCLRSRKKKRVFHVLTDVYFKPLTLQERTYYVKHYKPYDKSGSYGIQEWIGLIGIERIEGSYTNVMGLPMAELYAELKRWK